LPPSLDLFTSLYEDVNHDVDLLCNKFAKYETQKRLWAATAVALFGQQLARGGRGRRRGT